MNHNNLLIDLKLSLHVKVRLNLEIYKTKNLVAIQILEYIIKYGRLGASALPIGAVT